MTTTTTTASVADTLATTKRVHLALRLVLADLDYGLSATTVYVSTDALVIVAPNTLAASRWETLYPDHTVTVDGHPVPLHIAVEGDVEGGRS